MLMVSSTLPMKFLKMDPPPDRTSLSSSESIALVEVFHHGKRDLYLEKWFLWTCVKCGKQFTFELYPKEVNLTGLPNDLKEWFTRLRSEEVIQRVDPETPDFLATQCRIKKALFIL